MFSIRIDSSQVKASFSELQARQVPFALALALTKLAQMGRELVRKKMPEVFDRPTPYTIRSVGIVPATKSSLTSDVHMMGMGNRWKFLEAETQGGKRYQRGFENLLAAKFDALAGLQATFGKAAKLDQYGNIPGNIYHLILSSLKAQRDPLNNTTPRSLTRRIRSGNAIDFFVGRPGHGEQPLGVWSRTYKLVPTPAGGRQRAARSTTVTKAFGKQMRNNYVVSSVHPILIFGRPGSYKVRLPFFKLVQAMVWQEQEKAFQAAMEQAMKTAKPS